MSSSVLN